MYTIQSLQRGEAILQVHSLKAGQAIASVHSLKGRHSTDAELRGGEVAQTHCVKNGKTVTQGQSSEGRYVFSQGEILEVGEATTQTQRLKGDTAQMQSLRQGVGG